MKSTSEGLRLRIFVHEALRYKHKPLYAALVDLARREKMAGAIVFRGIEGYGAHRRLHTTRLVDVADDLPIIIEIVDTPEKIQAFLPLLDGLIPRGSATLSPVQMITYTRGMVP